LIITGLGLFAGGMAAAEVPAETATVSVAPGETLSDIAIRFAPASDTGAVVERIKLLNGLHGAAIAPGTPLTVPVRSGLASSGS
jgi:LysM repeat protein